jgi:hypothetical protein
MTTHPDALFEVPKHLVHLSFRPELPDIGLGFWFATDKKFATRMSYDHACDLIDKHSGPRGGILVSDPICPRTGLLSSKSMREKCVVTIDDEHDFYHLPTMYLVCPR